MTLFERGTARRIRVSSYSSSRFHLYNVWFAFAFSSSGRADGRTFVSNQNAARARGLKISAESKRRFSGTRFANSPANGLVRFSRGQRSRENKEVGSNEHPEQHLYGRSGD